MYILTDTVGDIASKLFFKEKETPFRNGSANKKLTPYEEETREKVLKIIDEDEEATK